MKTLTEYIAEIKDMITERKGEYDKYMELQVVNTAHAMWMRDKIVEELNGESLISFEIGSSGQQKIVENPLNQRFQKQVELVNNSLKACGLNYDATPSKMRNSEITNSDGLDELKSLMKTMQ